MSKIVNEQAPKRVKVTLACVICRKKKVKCDGIQPSCSRCQSIGNCCQYSDPPKKRGPPKGYVEVIESRAHRIESLLGNQQNKQQQQILIIKKDQPINALLCLISGAVDNALVHGSNGIVYDFLMTEDVLFNAREKLIFHHQDLWTENFFNHFNFMFPILSRPQFAFQLERDELNPLLKFAVFLLGCRLENKDIQQEKVLYQHFLGLSNDFITIPDITTVQAVVIMCWYTYIAGDMVKCYSLRHQLAQLVTEMNLGYESDNSKDIHYVEMKRRAFWVSFVIDQWLASCTGGERLLTQSWDCKWPQLEDNQLFALHHQQQEQKLLVNTCYFSIESALQINSFNEMIRLSNIVADMCNGDNVNKLESKLTEWLLQLPSYLDYGKPTAGEPSALAKLYRIFYHTVQIMLNNNSSHNSGLCTSICTTAANTIIHISERMVDLGQQKYLYNVFFSSLTLATSIHLDKVDKISLYKSISIIKQINCCLLPAIDFDALMDQFLVEDTPIYPSPTSSSSSLPKVNNKRAYNYEEDDQVQFDLVDIFPNIMDPVVDNSQWPSWLDFFDNQTVESSTTTCSPISYITPSHSPILSLCLKDEDIIPFDLLSDQQYFSLL
ncbi:hypothetical protein INT47_005014 [Mucor saturninus]|uniref:Zn(2)-C6 fungal-type domain-containing protein n=1 Tax=Mucor saturninus TaxID=64648 RepID=A0A8H7QJN1_9FUNG|nr:hypothetical protein INT47_005014 [Mucor saturninus]